jgi:hypothetical protein
LVESASNSGRRVDLILELAWLPKMTMDHYLKKQLVAVDCHPDQVYHNQQAPLSRKKEKPK